MKKNIFFAALLLLATVLTSFGETARDPLNPILWADVPDLSVLRHGDTYYMTSTAMHLNPGVPVMKSKDLIHWEIVSYCYDTLDEPDLPQDVRDRLTLENGKNEYSYGTWASSIRFHDGKFYVSTFSPATGKTYIFVSDDPEKGNWEKHSFRPALHDHTLVFAEDGRIFMIYGSGDRKLVELKSDLTGLKEGGVDQVLLPLKDSIAAMGLEGGFLMEGTQIHFINGKYYVFNIAWPPRDVRKVFCSRSDSLFGPYEGKTLFSCEGIAQGGLVDTPDGKWFALLFGDRGGVGRIPYLVPVTWEDGWPVLGTNDGTSLQKLEIPTRRDPIPACTASDEFTRNDGDRPLPLVWQWNHIPDNSRWTLTERPGFLRLKTGKVVSDLLQARNTLTQRTFGPTCTGSVAMDVSKMKDGDVAGLAAFQAEYGFVGIQQTDKNRSLVTAAVREKKPVVLESIPFVGDTVYLRMECDFRPLDGRGSSDLSPRADQAAFFYSLDGETWTQIGEPIPLPYTIPHFMGYRFAIFNYASKESGGFVDVDYFRVGTEPQTCSTLKDHFSKLFDVGTAFSPWQIQMGGEAGKQLTDLVVRQFSSITPENAMKPDALYRGDGQFNFREADILVQFAQEHGMKLRGHTLVWHSQTPHAFFLDSEGKPLDKEQLYARMERYMTGILEHFKGKISCWDVVNEALADGGPETYRTNSPWYKVCGKDFIAQAFRTAHKIDPEMKLYYNDYNLISPEKRARAVKMLKELKDAGVPIDGVGMQAHWDTATFDPAELQKSIDAFSELGLDVQITELDMTVYSIYHGKENEAKNRAQAGVLFTPEIERRQAEKYGQAFEVLCRNADKISCVTFWGVSDRFSWLNGFPRTDRRDFPLLFDEKYQPKGAFYEIMGYKKNI